MKLRNNIRIAGAITLIGMMTIAGQSDARENLGSLRKNGLKTSAAGCQPATAAIDLDINNVNARLMTGGDMWWNIGLGVAAYEIPIGSGKSSQFAASCWIGGYDQQNQLKVAGQTYRQSGNDYWPGALDVNAKITSENCSNWDYFWKVDKSVLNSFIQLSKTGGNTSTANFQSINQWPAVGNANALGNNGTPVVMTTGNTYAPFVDLNGNGVYEPNLGEYPAITGDEYIWWVFNDAGNVKEMSLTAAIGVEVQTSAFAYATQDFLNNSTFCNYRVINRGALTIDSTYIAVWDDCDLGYYYDDFIGCDTTRGLGIQYNGTNCDGCGAGDPVNSYGENPPQVGLDYFQGPKKVVHRGSLPDTTETLSMTNFTYYNNDFSVIGNPTNGIQMYYYMTGSITTGQRFSDDFNGPGNPTVGYGSGPVSNFVFWGDPSDNTQWSECACKNNPGDRRFIFSAGPFQLVPGAINDITFGCVWAPQPVGGCGATNFNTIKSIDDGAQALFDNHFQTVEGPNAPRMVCRELDRKLVFYLVNDYGSNNYGENYGRSDGTYLDSLQYHQAVVKAEQVHSADSLYRFEGYRVFQLANSTVQAADIFNQTTGEVDPAKAVEVFNCDVTDGVKQIVNYVVDVAVSDSTYIPQIKVTTAKDSGIVHSFELTTDQFATTPDRTFIDYQSYYFVAIAYAYNNFTSFNADSVTITQDAPYIGSAHGAGGIDVPIITAMPNPANGAMGTIINAQYGSGVTVTRVEGVGNGGNAVQMDSTSEMTAVLNGSITDPVYLAGQAPINVKVVDPVLVPAFNWILQIDSPSVSDTSGITPNGNWTLIGYNSTTSDTIYSEENISLINEQIIQQYGISVSIAQVPPPGANGEKNGNGYITSDITFANTSEPWLWGVQSMPDSSFANWLRTGNIQTYSSSFSATNPCYFNDYTQLDINSNYANLLANFSPAKSTWGPYVLAAAFWPLHASSNLGGGTQCGFDIAFNKNTQVAANFATLPDVNVVFTSDKSLWTRCAVIEEQEDPNLAQGGAYKFLLRAHAGWDGEVASDGNTPIYSESDSDQGMSWFPGYAVDEGTGNRLDIVFGEDSYLASDNGNDMLWNPSSNIFSTYDNSIIFGGKHVVYILGTKYDSDRVFVSDLRSAAATIVTSGSTSIPNSIPLRNAYTAMQWVGIPTLNPSTKYLSLANGLIPTTTTLRFRVDRPYAPYFATDTTNLAHVLGKGMATNPYYTFSTTGLAATTLSDTSNRKNLLSEIYAVPNPYYGYDGYEQNRLDTRVRIINLPAQVTITIYTLDGSLVRVLTKNDPTTSYIDWDIRNTVGLPVASGMYLIDVQAAGIGETVLKWFGAQRPIDVSTY
jgi:hypothetical protein